MACVVIGVVLCVAMTMGLGFTIYAVLDGATDACTKTGARAGVALQITSCAPPRCETYERVRPNLITNGTRAGEWDYIAERVPVNPYLDACATTPPTRSNAEAILQPPSAPADDAPATYQPKR